MSKNKRFELAWEDYDGWGINDTLGEYSDDEDYTDWLSGQKAVDVLNHFVDENEQLKEDINKRIVDYNGLNAEYEWLKEENNKLKSILEEMKDKNGEIWLMDGRIIKLKKVF